MRLRIVTHQKFQWSKPAVLYKIIIKALFLAAIWVILIVKSVLFGG